jgi:hypothetical protein
MKFPDKLSVTVSDVDSGDPLDKIAVILRLFATRKNDYSVGPQLTNELGEVEITKADCEFSIEQAQKMFLMDYAGDLSACRPVIELGLLPPENIAVMLEQYKASPNSWSLGLKEPDSYFAALHMAKNAEYLQETVTLTEAQLSASPRVSLKLRKKRPER